jgi:hypothetical protein
MGYMSLWKKKKKKKHLLSIQTDEGADLAEIQKLKVDIQMMLSKEELWWRQRANEDWLKYSDRNTKY